MLNKIFTKERIVRWSSAVLIAIGAAAAGMQSAEVQKIVCEK